MPDDELTYEPLEGPSGKKRKALKRNPGRENAVSGGKISPAPSIPPAFATLLTPAAQRNLDQSLTQEILYMLRLDIYDKAETVLSDARIETWWRPANAQDQRPKQLYLDDSTLAPSQTDAALFSLLLKICTRISANGFDVPVSMLEHFKYAAKEQRLRAIVLENGEKKMRRLVFTEGAFSLKMSSELLPDGRYRVIPYLTGNDMAVSFSTISHIMQPPHRPPLPRRPAFVISERSIIMADMLGAAGLLAPFIGHHSMEMDAPDAEIFTRKITSGTEIPVKDAPCGKHLDIREQQPSGELYVRTAKYLLNDREMLHAELSFAYGDISIPDGPDEAQEMRITKGNTVIIRNGFDENMLRSRLTKLGFRYNKAAFREEIGWKLEPSLLDNAVRTLVMEGWKVNAQGKSYCRPTMKTPSVSSGIDWFEISSGVIFNGREISMPEILSACRRNSNTVLLDDGTYGILPEEWLVNFTALTQLGNLQGEKLRFRMQQATIINALLEERGCTAGNDMQAVLEKFGDMETPVRAKAPEGFNATLREYQENGLGWLLKMREAGLGACLADDMGLGKTVQVLALLEYVRRTPGHLVSLVVMPRSLVFNWQAEAAKFTPMLKIHVHHGALRKAAISRFREYDAVFTTYGTLRNDVALLGDMEFEYCILDESQNIKNYESSTARAARCIKARHRIAMTGTPVENNLTELFSQLDFLNPGLFNMAPFLKKSGPALETLHRGTGPFILRRTKKQVAKDLPPKTEQILWCQMDEKEKQTYDELLAYYRNELSDESAGGDMQVLAALMRLRQASCHPGLLNPAKANEQSAKLEVLMENISSIAAEGHKILVFSQFTSFLRIIGRNLEKMDLGYCYLDGETGDRGALVELFSTDDSRKVFLISLKAGGVGLNLTAAEYVFLADPWWNPATEAQAVDRAYRIGQTNPVFAYRLVTKGTVEEKVMQMQNEKRRLANAVIDEDSGLPGKISGADLRSLLA